MAASLERTAAVAFSKNDFAEAARVLNQLVEADPKNSLHLSNRAACNEKLELYRKAIKDCDQAVELDANNLAAYLIKGRSLWGINKKTDAMRTWQLGSEKQGPIEILATLVSAAAGNADAALKAAKPATPTEAPQSRSSPTNSGRASPAFNGDADDSDSTPSSTPFRFEKPTNVPQQPTDIQQMDAKSLEALVTVAARGMVQHGVGDQNVDQQIALGYLQVNTGAFENGIKIFNSLLAKNPRVVAAYLGRGTANALMGRLDEASRDFSAAIEVDPQCVDAWKRRGQTRAARGLDSEGLKDLTMAISMSKDHEVYHQRGLINYKLKNFKRALEDFINATKYDHANKMTWNHIGLCYNAIGQCKESVEAHLKALSLDSNMKEALTNLGQTYREWGKADKAIEYYNKALALDANYFHAYHMRALTYFGLGQHNDALQDFTRTLQREPEHFEARWMRAVVENGLGMLRRSIQDYEACLKIKPNHFAWYQKEIALFWHHHLDTPLKTFNIDKALGPVFKEFWCKRNNPSTMPGKERQPALNANIKDVDFNETPNWSAPLHQLSDLAWNLGKMLNQDAAGFLFNRRQLRMAGWAAVELAQTLRAVIRGDDTTDGKESSNTNEAHKFGWRDMYDITIKWRQYSEPNDPVWWVDLLTKEQFSEGFGSHTPIITGQCKVVRYGPMFQRALSIMKSLMQHQLVLSDEMTKRIEKAETCEELYAIMRRDFWVVTPCHSTASPGKTMEGTRLTLQATPPEGYEYSIRTPGTPPRWVDYALELNFVFDQFIQEARKPSPDLEELSKWILTTTFYWYNFMPLSRGTAATGYIALMGMFLAVGVEITAKIPTGELIDWDGILLPTPEEFIKTFSRWLYPGRTRIDLATFDKLPLASEEFSTIRKLIEALTAKPSKGW